MTIETEQFANDRTAYLQSARRKLDDWRDKLNQLQEEIGKFSSEAQAEHQKTTADLRDQLEQAEVRLKELEQSKDAQWEENQPRWQEAAEEYSQSFAKFANRMNKEDVPLDWLEDYTDERIRDSVGWAEGQGKKDPGSKGWAEGYDQSQS